MTIPLRWLHAGAERGRRRLSVSRPVPAVAICDPMWPAIWWPMRSATIGTRAVHVTHRATGWEGGVGSSRSAIDRSFHARFFFHVVVLSLVAEFFGGVRSVMKRSMSKSSSAGLAI